MRVKIIDVAECVVFVEFEKKIKGHLDFRYHVEMSELFNLGP